MKINENFWLHDQFHKDDIYYYLSALKQRSDNGVESFHECFKFPVKFIYFFSAIFKRFGRNLHFKPE